LGERFLQNPGASRRGNAEAHLEFNVIASEAKQSISPRKEEWIGACHRARFARPVGSSQ
jgi:hypothetical protein